MGNVPNMSVTFRTFAFSSEHKSVIITFTNTQELDELISGLH
jgi:hypothetical protein